MGRVVVTADGAGVVSHAGAGLLREMATETGLVEAWDSVLLDTYKAVPVHMPGQVLADLAVAIADGAVSISDLAALRDQPDLEVYLTLRDGSGCDSDRRERFCRGWWCS